MPPVSPGSSTVFSGPVCPAGRSSPSTYLTRRAIASFGRTDCLGLCPTRDGGLDLAALSETISTLPDSGGAGQFPRQVLAGRKPPVLLRFVGAFLLRLAERTFPG